MKVLIISTIVLSGLCSCLPNENADKLTKRIKVISEFHDIRGAIAKIRVFKLESAVCLNEIADTLDLQFLVSEISKHKEFPRKLLATHNLEFLNENDSIIFSLQYHTMGLLKSKNGGVYQLSGDSTLVRLKLLNR